MNKQEKIISNMLFRFENIIEEQKEHIEWLYEALYMLGEVLDAKITKDKDYDEEQEMNNIAEARQTIRSVINDIKFTHKGMED